MAERINRKWILAGTIVAVVGVAIVLNWRMFALALAFSTSERRPALLADAQWNAPASAHDFLNRFRTGTEERELLGWLQSNEFKVDRSSGRAERVVRSLPCNEHIEVIWSKALDHTIDKAEVRLSEAGCL
jgi:hypothetical protein